MANTPVLLQTPQHDTPPVRIVPAWHSSLGITGICGQCGGPGPFAVLGSKYTRYDVFLLCRNCTHTVGVAHQLGIEGV